MGGSGVLAALALASAAHAQPADRDVMLSGGPVPLHGSLLAPERRATGAAVLIIAGSGPTDRNGNSRTPAVHPNTYLMLARALSTAGITSLRVDKRLIGASTAPGAHEDGLTLHDYVDDAVGWGRFLLAQPGVRCVVLVGHSEGALVAALAANRIPSCGVVSVAGSGRPLGAVIAEQLRVQPLPPALLQEAIATLKKLQAGERVASPPAPLAALFRPSVQGFLISELRASPTAAIAAVRAPVLIVQGDHDIQVSVDDARALAAAHPGAALAIVAGMNHVLKPAPADRTGNIATYADPDLALAPALAPQIIAFVQRVGGS